MEIDLDAAVPGIGGFTDDGICGMITTMPSDTFDVSRARLRGPDYFKRYRAPENGQPLAASGLGNDVELLVVQRGGERRALVMREVSYHHVAQGRLAGEPYVVSF